MIILIWLVVLTILKNMKVNGKDDIPYMKWKIMKIIQSCLKPPTSYDSMILTMPAMNRWIQTLAAVPRHQHRPQQLQRPAPTFALRRSDGRGEADLSRCRFKRLGDGQMRRTWAKTYKTVGNYELVNLLPAASLWRLRYNMPIFEVSWA